MATPLNEQSVTPDYLLRKWHAKVGKLKCIALLGVTKDKKIRVEWSCCDLLDLTVMKEVYAEQVSEVIQDHLRNA